MEISSLPTFLDYARGDPKLSFWEEGFLASLTGRVRASGLPIWISPKQSAILDLIAIKIEQPDGISASDADISATGADDRVCEDEGSYLRVVDDALWEPFKPGDARANLRRVVPHH